MTTDFQKVKEAYPLIRYVENQGVKAKGEFYNPAPCCSHNDCFHVDAEKDLWKCFSCDAGGDIFDLHMTVNGCDKATALRELAADRGVELGDCRAPRKAAPLAMTGKAAVWQAAAEIFCQALLDDKAALDYQKKVRRHQLSTLKKFKVGWAKGKLVEELKERGFKPAELIKSGLVKKNDGGHLRDYFDGCFVYPSFDAAGRPLHFRCKFPKPSSVRSAQDKLQANYQLTNDHKDKEWICYNQAALGKYDELLVCEGEDDLLTWHESGVSNVVATCGGPTDAQLNFFVKHHPAKVWLLAYDPDEAGRSYVERFRKRGLNVKVLPAPEAA